MVQVQPVTDRHGQVPLTDLVAPPSPKLPIYIDKSGRDTLISTAIAKAELSGA